MFLTELSTNEEDSDLDTARYGAAVTSTEGVYDIRIIDSTFSPTEFRGIIEANRRGEFLFANSCFINTFGLGGYVDSDVEDGSTSGC